MTYCPACGAPVPASAINESLAAARCPACGRLFDTAKGAPKVKASGLASAALLARPERFAVDDTSGAFKVSWRWYNPSVFFLIPFALFWNGLLFGFGHSFAGGDPWKLLFGLAVPHVWVGVGLVYYIFTLFLNATTLLVEGDTLSVRHGPLPWFGNRKVPVTELEQLFVLERRGNKGGLTYELCALLSGDRRQTLLKSQLTAEEARYLEVRLEKELGIVDRAVVGELEK